MKKVLFIIANEWFQDFEFWEPKRILEKGWIIVEVAAWKKWVCIGAFWVEVEAIFSLNEIDWNNYDMIVFIWWPWAYGQYIDNNDYGRIAKEAKLLWAICIAPTIVSYSWVLKRKKVTGWDSWWEQKTEIEDNWWIFINENVVIDGNIITANWPRAATKFGNELLKKLI
jgi:protease I